MRAGVDDVLTVEATPDEWTEAIERARIRVAAEHEIDESRGDALPGRGRIVTVFSTKGGCGKSLVASNLAVLAASATSSEVALVDLDLQSGDLSIMFQLMPALSIFDAAQSVDQLDAEAMRGYLTRHSSGVSLLAAPTEPSMAEQVPAAKVGQVIHLLQDMFPLIIVDTPAMFTDQVLAALDASDLIILVGSMDVPSLKNLRLAMRTLQQLGHPDAKIRIVLNRADSKVGLRMNEVEKLLGTKIDVAMPSSRDAAWSINQGSPLAVSNTRSPIVRAIEKLLPWVLPPAVRTDRRRDTARTRRR
jgi:pilus assembly protein CpaE